MREEIVIQGAGVAACCCASLLSKAGHRVFLDQSERIGTPVLLLSEQTQLLLRDVFGHPQLFDGATKISKRVVSWGQEPVTFPHAGLVLPEALLLSRLWPKVEVESGGCSQPDHWTVCCTRQPLGSLSQREFGSRMASTYSVELSASTSDDSCWVEAVRDGWLFLIPCGEGFGSLISVGKTAETLLGQSKLVAQEVFRVGEVSGSFPAHPRIAQSLFAGRSILCGTAAVAFDPIAGEGAGHAMRQGILASAVIRAAGNGGTEEDLLKHYSNRILSGFCRHLEESSRYYTIDLGPWWSHESEQIRQGITWAGRELTLTHSNRFRLMGFELESI